jgi:hypothetical protein
LNWSKIIYNNIKLELMRKKTKGILALHSVVYLTKMMDPTQPTLPPPTQVDLTISVTMEIRSTSKELLTKKRKESKYKEYQEFVIRMRAQNLESILSTFTLDKIKPSEVIVIGDTTEETPLEIQLTVAQQTNQPVSKKSELCRTIELYNQRYNKLATAKERVEEEKVKLTSNIKQYRRAMINLTLEVEGLTPKVLRGQILAFVVLGMFL